MASRAPKKDDFDPQVPHERKEPRPDFSEPPPAKKLPKALQDTLDNDEKLWDALYDGT
jgi:fission process protein 1